MTITKQSKSILYLLAIAIMVALMSIACKNKATAPVASFSSEDATEEVIIPEETVTPVEPVTPAPTPSENAFSKYAGTYESHSKYSDNGKDFYTYKAVIEGNNIKLYKGTSLWRDANSVNGTTTVKDWETWNFVVSGNKIVLNFPNNHQITVWKDTYYNTYLLFLNK